jgi:hypothetical protein
MLVEFISTFPFQDELDQPCRNTLWADARKRKTPDDDKITGTMLFLVKKSTA